MNNMIQLRRKWDSGELEKLQYQPAVWSQFDELFEVSDFLCGTNVNLVEIVPEGVIISLISPPVRMWYTKPDHGNIAIANVVRREYEREEIEMFLSLAKDGDVFFDIGANLGVYSLAFAKKYPNSQIHAFEPIHSTLNEMRRNLFLNSVTNVTSYNVGLSDHYGDVSFYFDETVASAASGAPLGEDFKETVLTAHIEKLDYFGHLRPSIIKCDVEGAELLVFKGGAETLKRYKPIIQCEMMRKWTKRFNYHPNDIIAFLGKLGYECFTLHDGKLDRFETMTEDTMEMNFYFIHPDRRII